MYDIIGNSPWASSMRNTITQVAEHLSNVLIIGDSGTGKELIARNIHSQSSRKDKIIVCCDCTSIPASLFASQLFGHVKGAFSGAVNNTLGMFRAADGGTIFLDEVGELSLDLQAQLLRVIQERRVIPVGSHESHPVDIRVVAATNRDLAEEVREGRFRLDLFYRLNVVTLHTQPLAERKEDIKTLCRYFMQRMEIENGLPPKEVSPEAFEILLEYNWPGNVRELQNVLERLLVFTQDKVIKSKHVIAQFDQNIITQDNLNPVLHTGASFYKAADLSGAQNATAHQAEPVSAKAEIEKPLSSKPRTNSLEPEEGYLADGEIWPTLAESEEQLILTTLKHTENNIRAAARLLDIDPRVLRRKLKKYEIDLTGDTQLIRTN